MQVIGDKRPSCYEFNQQNYHKIRKKVLSRYLRMCSEIFRYSDNLKWFRFSINVEQIQQIKKGL